MSVLSLSYWEIDVYWRQNSKHFAERAPRHGGKQLIWRHYVTVTLCIKRITGPDWKPATTFACIKWVIFFIYVCQQIWSSAWFNFQRTWTHVYVRYMLSTVRLSSVWCLKRSCALLSWLKFSAIFLRNLVGLRWPSFDIHGKFYGDCTRGTSSSGGELNAIGVAKYSNFGPIKGYISETVQYRM